MQPRVEPPLRPDELRTVRAMISEYGERQAVDKWFTARARLAVAIVSVLGGVAVVASSILTIAGHLG